MIRLFRFALHLLPADLRRKHGAAMENLFARNVAARRVHGRLPALLTGATQLVDLAKRAAYEHWRANMLTFSRGGHMAQTDLEQPVVAMPTTSQLLRAHAVSFIVAFVGLTGVMLINQFAKLQSIAQTDNHRLWSTLLLSVPFVAAMTIPMAVFVAVLYQFSRLGATGVLAAVRRVPNSGRRLVMPVLTASALIAMLALSVTTLVLPQANYRLGTTLHGAAFPKGDRSMTVGELQDAARNESSRRSGGSAERIAAYQTEVQKKFALPAACVALALAAMSIAWCFPHGGTMMVIGASGVLFAAYYTMLIVGESLTDSLTIPPFVGMWGANAVVLTVALVAAWRISARRDVSQIT